MVLKFYASELRKFVILLYKGLLLRKRHYIVTAFEIVFPVLIASIPAIIQSEANIPRDYSSVRPDWVNDTIYTPFNPFASGPKNSQTVLFVYAPSNGNTKVLMEESIQLWKSYHNGIKTAIEPRKDADDLENFCMITQRENGSLLIIGTVFNNIPSGYLPSSLDYTIRYASSYYSFGTNMKYRFSKSQRSDMYSGSTFFLSWQAAVEKTFIKKKMVEGNLDYDVSMQEFPND